PAQGVEFLGRVVAGPFHEAAPGGYRLTGTVEVLGELLEGERVRTTSTRPRPGAAAYVLAEGRLERLLGLGGDLGLGHLAGHPEVRARLGREDKNFLPRNVGIFGTVGSGKSNTAQVLIEEGVAAGWAVVEVDLGGGAHGGGRGDGEGRGRAVRRVGVRADGRGAGGPRAGRPPPARARGGAAGGGGLPGPRPGRRALGGRRAAPVQGAGLGARRRGPRRRPRALRGRAPRLRHGDRLRRPGLRADGRPG